MWRICFSILQKMQQLQGEEAHEEICEKIHWEKWEETLLDTQREGLLLRTHVARSAFLEEGTPA